MKTWKFIQKGVVVVAFITTVALIDGTSVTAKDTWTAFVMLALIVIYVFNACVEQEKKEEAK